jgi:hypothetical protein
VNPDQGWQRPYSEPVPGGTAYWFGPIHGAICRPDSCPQWPPGLLMED